MKFTLEFDCDNAAFDDQPEVETARILRKVADGIESGAIEDRHVIRDINGNNIGFVEVEDDG